MKYFITEMPKIYLLIFYKWSLEQISLVSEQNHQKQKRKRFMYDYVYINRLGGPMYINRKLNWNWVSFVWETSLYLTYILYALGIMTADFAACSDQKTIRNSFFLEQKKWCVQI